MTPPSRNKKPAKKLVDNKTTNTQMKKQDNGGRWGEIEKKQQPKNKQTNKQKTNKQLIRRRWRGINQKNIKK